ncbi:MAG TPA: YraN family protein [Flavobacteriales bacterium]|nr:YraN family protein [Flavobacteriales bacterium]
MAEHNSLGIRGEKIAIKMLKEKGYEILETNWRFSKAEIDVIATISDILVIVEVKTRTNQRYGNPEEFVTVAKQKLLIKAANAFIEERNSNSETRFDVVGITIKNIGHEIIHHEDAFSPLVTNR